MPRINRINKKKFAEVIKLKKLQQKQLQQKQLEKVKVAEPQPTEASVQDTRFDTFVRKTAKDIMKDFPRYDLKTNKTNSGDMAFWSFSLSNLDSVWAPWSKFIK